MSTRTKGRACDACSRRKIRCDGPNPPSGCSNCQAFSSPCTYLRHSVKRGLVSIDDTNRKNEIASLVRENTSIKIENASLKSENLLLRDEISSLKAKLRSLSLCSLCQAPIVVPSERDSIFPRDTSISTAVDEPSTNDEDVTGDELASRFQQFSLESVKNKIFKTAGSFALANDAMAMKERYLGGPVASHARRRLFWDTLPWEKGPYECHYVFPQPDLITSLVQVYFATVHATFPVLHRPSFERPLAEGLHLTDHDFGGLLLAVLAVASRYSDDPRVLVEGDDTVLSAGWKYANQIQIILGKSPDPSIYEVQMYALCSRYVLGTSRPEVCSLYTDLGISCLRLRGEYRRKRDEHNVNLQDEEWRRVFWFYLVFDRMGCVFHGRPPGFDLEDEDVDLPLEVDDEYWERGFVQPLGKPPLQSYLVQHARLCIILGDAMRRLYVSTETKMRFGWHGSEWERSTVAELDSAMNDFLDSIPPHLRWDPVSPPQGTFFDQSLALHVAFQHIQITIHRPYIHKMGALAGPALSICTGAARSILHMASVWLARRRWQPPTLMNSVFVSGIILVLNMFNTKRAHPGLSMDLKKDLAHVDTAMEVMKVLESRFQPVGRLRDLLCSLAAGTSVDAAPLHPEHPRPPASAADKLEQSPPGHGHSQIHLEPGVSIEQLLAATSTPFDQDDVLMSMWTDVPADFANLNEWDAYIGNLSAE